MNNNVKEQIDFTKISSFELLEYVSFKEEFPDVAEKAFMQFCFRFEKDAIKKAEIFCTKFKYNEVIALQIAQCAFARIWKYPTFDPKKAKSKDEYKAILLWISPIIYTQLLKFQHKDTCEETNEDEDLCTIGDIETLIDVVIDETDVEAKRKLKIQFEVIESAMEGLCHKRRIIYLTYKAYEQKGKKLPRTLLKKLRDQLDLTQTSVRVYKREANNHVGNYLKMLNGSK